MRVYSAAALAAFIVGMALPVSAQTTTALPAAKIDADVNAAIAAQQMHGATIAIIQEQRIVYTQGYGLRDVAKALPAQVDTQYEIGSITKQFTAAAVLQLMESGKMSLDAKLATYLPTAPHASDVTIRQMLSHTSGIPEYLEGESVVLAAGHPATVAQILERIKGKPLDFVPGTKYEYSNTNYFLLGRVIEVVSHQPYEQYMMTHVFARAGVASLTTMRDEPHLSDFATGYEHGKLAPPLDESWAWSAGNIVGTVGDLAAWDAALSSAKVVDANDYAQMTSRQTPRGSAAYGFGFVIDHHDGQLRIWHNGGTFGFSTSDQFYPTQKTRIIVFTNDSGGDANALATRIFDDLYPQFSSADLIPAPGENPALTARFKKITLELLAGHIDHSQFDAAANAKLTDAFVKEAGAQLSTLGKPGEFVYKGSQVSGTSTIYQYMIPFAAGTYKLTIATDADGKLNTIFIGAP